MLLQTHNLYARAGMLSNDGRCKTFDARANGYVRGEGVGALVLHGMPVPTAGVSLRDSIVRSDGKSASLTAPSGKAQARMLSEVIALSSICPPSLVETHGTGTPLGDPTEMGGLESALGSAAPCLGGAKANVGHTEPVAGLLGLLALARSTRQKASAVNAQLRILNPMLAPRLRRLQGRLSSQSLDIVVPSAGVSSFGYSGTIAHAMITKEEPTNSIAERKQVARVYERTTFPWFEVSHPFLQVALPSTDPNHPARAFVSRMHGNLRSLVADHVVQDRIIFPAAGYLEMAHATSLASKMPSKLNGVFFLLPLSLSDAAEDALVTIEITPQMNFQVSSIGISGDAEVHCSGNLLPTVQTEEMLSFAGVRERCTDTIQVSTFYSSLHMSGLSYGPKFRLIDSIWAAPEKLPRLAVLSPRKSHQGMNTHPADLDAALQLSVANLDAADSKARLPFAVDDVHFQPCTGSLWANVETQGKEGHFVALVSSKRATASRLHGFKARELRAVAKREPWYCSEWRIGQSPTTARVARPLPLLLVSDTGNSPGCKRLDTFSSQASVAEATSNASAAIFASTLQQGSFGRGGMSVMAAALSLVQMAAATLPIWFFTTNVLQVAPDAIARPVHAGAWGLARTARAEAMLPLRCVDLARVIDATAMAKVARGGPDSQRSRS